MTIRERLVKENNCSVELFDYYKSIGCTDNQSLVLSLYTYGNSYGFGIYPFKYFYNKKIEDKVNIPFCDFLAEKILSVENVSLRDALENTEEYKSYNRRINAVPDSVEGCLNESFVGNTSFAVPPLGTPFLGNNSKKSIKKSFFDGLFSKSSKEEKGFGLPIKETNQVVNNYSFCSGSDECFDDVDSEEFFEACSYDSEAFDNAMQVQPLQTSVTESIIRDYMEKVSTDSYETIEEKGFLNPLTSPTSTFRMTSNTAAFGVLRNNKGRPLNSSMVRIEELLNNFEYKLSKPTQRMFNINTQMCDKPNSKNKLLFVGVQGKDIIPQRQNITLLLDTSGSMSGNNTWTQAAMITIVKQLKDNDVLSLVCYSDKDRTVFANKIINKDSFDEFIEILYSIMINGCTWGSKGIETAYALANNTYIKDGINRVILMTDGDLNFGITDKGGLKDLILSKKDNGIFLSVLGTGLYNYKDDNLETLAKNGNGNYCTIDCIEDIKENIFEKYNSLVFTIAKDVKAQVEFNPKFIKKYRLIGYENRALNHEDFRNDAVISEPFGCGSYGVALYELEMQDGAAEIKSDLKYQQAVLTDVDSICTVSVRYKEPLATESQELSVEVKNKTAEMKDNLLLAYLITVIGERLRNSEYYNEKDKKFVTDMVYKNGLGDLYDKNADKFQTLMSFIEK